MAKTYVSPGVFVNEVDQSFLGAGINQIGGALIGLAPKGPAFVPVRVTDYNQFISYFGDLDEDYPLAYAAKAYLKNSGVANIVRVLGPSGRTNNGTAVNPGYTAESMWAITCATGSAGVPTVGIAALIEVTGSGQLKVVADQTDSTMVLRISSSFVGGQGVDTTNQTYFTGTVSFLSASDNYIGKVMNTDPTKFSEKGYYVREIYDYVVNSICPGGLGFYSSASYSGMTNFQIPFLSASTPWIKSQEFGGNQEYNLFKIHTMGHGEYENTRFKISVTNIKQPVNAAVDPYGKFTLLVRTYGDNDKAASIVEQFADVDLNPQSRNYIAKIVGDKHWEYDNNKEKMVSYGDYSGYSKFVRVEMTTGSYPQGALPWGFRGFAKPMLTVTGTFTQGSDILVVSGSEISGSGIKELPYVANLKDKETQSEASDGIYWGVEFNISGNIASRLVKLPAMTGSDTDFSLKFVSGSTEATLVYDTSLTAVASKKSPGDALAHSTLSPTYAKFTLPMAGGFDGFDRRVDNPLANETQLAALTQIGPHALRQAIDVVADPDFIDINLLAIPGIHSNKVVEYGITAIENRADAFYVIDISGSSVTEVTREVKGRRFDTNYAGVYYPGITVFDTINEKNVAVPASVAAVGAIAYNDRVAYPWFAPAGLNRGGLNIDTVGFDVVGTADRLTATERDSLYENRINPIATFPAEGIAVWGQKTLQLKASALDRINVRRLLIKAKKLVASAVKYLVFEPNNPSTWTSFKQMVNPILADIQLKNGLEQFKVIMDSTTTTPDLIDRNVMKGVIALVPTRSAEFIVVDFVINRSGVTFED